MLQDVGFLLDMAGYAAVLGVEFERDVAHLSGSFGAKNIKAGLTASGSQRQPLHR